MNHCRLSDYTLADALSSTTSYEGERHVEACLMCQICMKFVQATIRRFSQQLIPRRLTLAELRQMWTLFERGCILIDHRNQRVVVKQELCFCGAVASLIPVPLREENEQRANLECLACGARWRVAHCRSGCGAPLDDRFDELCPSCKWIKCPAGHCSNDACLEEPEKQVNC